MQACSRLQDEIASGATPSSCFKCGEEGHFARECTSAVKVHFRIFYCPIIVSLIYYSCLPFVFIVGLSILWLRLSSFLGAVLSSADSKEES